MRVCHETCFLLNRNFAYTVKKHVQHTQNNENFYRNSIKLAFQNRCQQQVYNCYRFLTVLAPEMEARSVQNPSTIGSGSVSNQNGVKEAQQRYKSSIFDHVLK